MRNTKGPYAGPGYEHGKGKTSEPSPLQHRVAMMLLVFNSKVISVVTSVATALILLNIHLTEKPSYLTQQNQTWQVPNTPPPQAIVQDTVLDKRRQNMQFEAGYGFAGIEKLLSPHYRIGASALQIQTNLELSLRKTMALLPDTDHETLLARLETSIQLTFPGAQGIELAELLKNYYHYHHNTKHLNSSEQDRQAFYFGELIATQLFAKQRALQNYLEERNQIRLSSTLSEAEKRQQLEQIKKAYETSKE